MPVVQVLAEAIACAEILGEPHRARVTRTSQEDASADPPLPAPGNVDQPEAMQVGGLILSDPVPEFAVGAVQRDFRLHADTPPLRRMRDGDYRASRRSLSSRLRVCFERARLPLWERFRSVLISQ